MAKMLKAYFRQAARQKQHEKKNGRERAELRVHFNTEWQWKQRSNSGRIFGEQQTVDNEGRQVYLSFVLLETPNLVCLRLYREWGGFMAQGRVTLQCHNSHVRRTAAHPSLSHFLFHLSCQHNFLSRNPPSGFPLLERMRNLSSPLLMIISQPF